MSTYLPVPGRDSESFNESQGWKVCDLSKLPTDLKRVLCVQFREFINHIEDCQPEHELELSPSVIHYLESCYREVA